MNRRTAKTIHQMTNAAFWIENPNWRSDNAAFDLLCRGVQKLPFSMYEIQKRMFFDTNRLLAVNGETVVAVNDRDNTRVDKFMFRYPGRMALKAYEQAARHEIAAVTDCLAGVALPTTVAIQPATILKARRPPLVVTQSQQRLDLTVHPEFNLTKLAQEARSPKLDRTAKDLEIVVAGAEKLYTEFEYYPDVAPSSGNLRRSNIDGAVSLIDVMPFYANGSRLIGGNPPNIITHLQENVAGYQAFIGSYGA